MEGAHLDNARLMRRTKVLRLVSTLLFGSAGVWFLVGIVLIGVRVPLPLGLLGGVGGSLVIAGIVYRQRSDPAFAGGAPPDGSGDDTSEEAPKT